MAREIERKFLVKDSSWYTHRTMGTAIRQGYIPTSNDVAVRLRVHGFSAFITIKADLKDALERIEYEYEIPMSDAEEMLDKLCGQEISKTRYDVVGEDGKLWSIDEFIGQNKGLVLAEIELNSRDESFIKPHWLGEEVTEDPRYRNVVLAQRPYNASE